MLGCTRAAQISSTITANLGLVFWIPQLPADKKPSFIHKCLLKELYGEPNTLLA